MFKCVFCLVLIGYSCAIAAESTELRDPTTPLGYTKKTVNAKISLQAIYKSADRSEAIVNGKLVRVGDSVQGAKIIAIGEKSIVYLRGGETKTVSLRPSIVKTWN